ncbi:hypothetical protein MKZ02_19545 [Pseudobacillus sp. FSL P4-0506]|uniref:hypothetical protein n=1 Tax=Pseudobacillus sp. FSL P4-0506 TaxID=2921576 RepID=UPI0030FB6CFD
MLEDLKLYNLIVAVLIVFLECNRTKTGQIPDKNRTKWVPFWVPFYFSIDGKIFLSASYLAGRRRIFPLSMMYSGVSND